MGDAGRDGQRRARWACRLDIECLDRIYLNGYVPNLQASGQVVTFLSQHLGYPFPSPALFDKIGTGSARRWPRSPRPMPPVGAGSAR